MQFRIILVLAFCSLFWRQQPEWIKIQIYGFAQGTSYQITYYTDSSKVSQQQVDSILRVIDGSLSIYNPRSLISQFNNGRKAISMDEHFKTVLEKSLDTWQQTDGIFDITVQPLVQAWGFGPQKINGLPDSADIQKLKTCVGSGYLKIKGNRLLKRKPCVKIDINGIAQGYSVDVLAGFLEDHGIHHYLVELGGEIRVKGKKQPGNTTMSIGIESPENEFDTGAMQQVIKVEKGAVTTSGSYRKFYESNGKKITHIIDSKTGYPIQNDLISVTVYAADAITADAYDNALMNMGLHKALQFAENRSDIAAYFIYRKENGVIADTASSDFYKLLQH